MTWLSIFAIYFIFWWLVLFATLPFGLRTQDDEDDVTLGTTASAPQGSHIGRALLRTTVVSAVLFGIFYAVTVWLGLTFDDIPKIGPDFGMTR